MCTSSKNKYDKTKIQTILFRKQIYSYYYKSMIYIYIYIMLNNKYVCNNLHLENTYYNKLN